MRRFFVVPALFAVLATVGHVTPLIAAEPAPVVAASAAATPEAAILQPVKVLRGNDFKGFYALLPPADKAKAEAEWKKAQADAKTGVKNKDVNELNDLLGKLLAPDAVNTLVAENEPKLASINPQETSQMLQMGAGFLPMMLAQPTPGQTPEQAKNKQALGAMLQGILTDASGWILTAGINDPKKLRSSIEHLVAGAKALGVKDVAELQALSFEDFLGRLGPIVKEAKLAAGVYDVGIDAFLDSITAVPKPGAAAAADEKILDVTFKAFGKPYTFPVTVQKKGNGWIVSPRNAEQFGPMKQMMPGGMPMGDGGGDAEPPAGMK